MTLSFKKKVLLFNELLAEQPMIQEGRPAGESYEEPKPPPEELEKEELEKEDPDVR